MKILEEFWYGNIEPTDYDTSSCKGYKKLQELICWRKPSMIGNTDFPLNSGRYVGVVIEDDGLTQEEFKQ